MILMVVGPEGRIRGKQRTLDARRMVAFWVGASCTAIFYTTPWAARGKQNWKIGSHWKNLKAEESVNYLLHEMHRGYKTQIIFLVLLCAWCQVIRNAYLGRHVQNSLPAYPHALHASRGDEKDQWEPNLVEICVMARGTWSQGLWTDVWQQTGGEISISEMHACAEDDDHGHESYSPPSKTWNPVCSWDEMASRRVWALVNRD